MYKRITSIIDTIFANVIIYAISFVWIRYYVKDLTSAIFLALTVTLVIYLFVKGLTSSKKESKELKVKEKKLLEKYLTSLIFLPREEAIEFLQKLYDNVYPILKMGDVTKEDVVKAVQWAQGCYLNSMTLVLPQDNKQITAYIKSISGIDIKVISSTTLLCDMQEKNYYPVCPVSCQKEKLKIKDILAYAFHRKRAKGYILTGFLLILSSFLIPYKIYYIVSGSVLLLLALICLTLNHES